MKRSSLLGLLSATLLVATAAPSFSQALTSSPLPDERQIVRVMAQNDGGGEDLLLPAQVDFDRGEGSWPHHSGPPGSGLHLAGKISAAETFVGITSAQLDAWRSYATALLELADRPGPDHQRGGPRRERPDGPPRERPDTPRTGQADGIPPVAGAHPPRADAPFFTEALAGRAIEQGRKAEVLKAAIAALRQVLTLEQTARLRDAERSFLPPPGPPGPGWPDDRAGRHHDWRQDAPPPFPFPPVAAGIVDRPSSPYTQN